MFYNKKEQTFYNFCSEKRMTFRHFGIILVENKIEKSYRYVDKGDSYET